MKSFSITINFINSEILNINSLISDFTFIKLYDKNKKKFELKYNNIFEQNNILSFDKIFHIKFIFLKKNYQIDINDKKKVIEKKDINYDFNAIIKMEILNNFYRRYLSIKII